MFVDLIYHLYVLCLRRRRHCTYALAYPNVTHITRSVLSYNRLYVETHRAAVRYPKNRELCVLDRMLTAADRTILLNTWRDLRGPCFRTAQKFCRRVFHELADHDPKVHCALRTRLDEQGRRHYNDNCLRVHAMYLTWCLEDLILVLYEGIGPRKWKIASASETGHRHHNLFVQGEMGTQTWRLLARILCHTLFAQNLVRIKKDERHVWERIVLTLTNEWMTGMTNGVTSTAAPMTPPPVLMRANPPFARKLLLHAYSTGDFTDVSLHSAAPSSVLLRSSSYTASSSSSTTASDTFVDSFLLDYSLWSLLGPTYNVKSVSQNCVSDMTCSWFTRSIGRCRAHSL